jgi:periplasmic protein TonB
MFESVKQGKGPNGTVYVTSLLVSMVVHTIILCLLILVPLLCFNALEAGELLTFLIEPPTPPPPPDPPSPPPVAGGGEHRGPNITKTDFAPRKIPIDIFPEPPKEPDNFGLHSLPGINDAIIGRPGGTGTIPTMAGFFPKEPIVTPPPPPPPPKNPIRIGILDPAKLIRKIDPVYPVLAVKAHVSGLVVIEAVIDEEGNVTNPKVLRGHPLLNEAAVDAVSQWKYSPTILSGEPVPVIATITVVFNLK